MAEKAIAVVLDKLRRSLLLHDTTGHTDGELLERFISRRDEAAFETLLHRHGPMVLGACRRILQNETDAEDAFQSTFLVLVRKAGSIRPRGMVGNWLYGVAHSTALKARAMRNQRLAKEREAAAQAKTGVTAETWLQLEALLDQELKVLPDKYRSAIVLCDLEGKSIKEAAQQIGCPPGTIGTRLNRGRSMLARRLARHGLAVSPGALAVALSQNAAWASVPASLALSTCRAAFLFAAGTAATGGVVSANVASLTQAVLKTMELARLQAVTAVLVIALLAGGTGVGFFAHPARPGEETASAERVDEPSLDKGRIGVVVSDKQAGEEAAKRAWGIGGAEGEPTATRQGLAAGNPQEMERNGQEFDLTSGAADVPEGRRAEPTIKLPPGLAKKAVNHPGRRAWLKTHGRPDGKKGHER